MVGQTAHSDSNVLVNPELRLKPLRGSDRGNPVNGRPERLTRVRLRRKDTV